MHVLSLSIAQIKKMTLFFKASAQDMQVLLDLMKTSYVFRHDDIGRKTLDL
jgi:hypothetical protein